MRADRRAGEQATCGRSPACATSARTSAARCRAKRSTGPNFAELWISVDPHADYDKTLTQIQATVAGLSRPLPRADDLPQGAHQRGARRVERGDRRPHLRAQPRKLRRQGPRGTQPRSRGSRASSTCAPSSRWTSRTFDVKPDLDKAAKHGLKPGDIRRAAATHRRRRRGRATCTSTTRSTTSSPGACRRRVTTCRASATCPSTRRAAAT